MAKLRNQVFQKFKLNYWCLWQVIKISSPASGILRKENLEMKKNDDWFFFWIRIEQCLKSFCCFFEFLIWRHQIKTKIRGKFCFEFWIFVFQGWHYLKGKNLLQIFGFSSNSSLFMFLGWESFDLIIFSHKWFPN